MTEKKRRKQMVVREFILSTAAVNNRITVFLLAGIIISFGLWSYITLPKENFPEIVFPQIYISTPYPGNSPVDIENLIARPVERELSSINGVKNIVSTSSQDYSSILVEFDTDIEISRALQDVKDAVDRSKSDLPQDLPADPSVRDIDISEMPIMFINIYGDYSLEELNEYAEYLEDKIEALSEISRVNIKGVPKKEVQINVDLYAMEASMISFGDIENAIQSENITMSGGNLLSDGFRRSVRVDGEFASVDEIEHVVVKDENLQIVYLRDIAEVKFVDEERTSISRLNGLPVVTLDVIKRGGENLINSADKITEIIENAKAYRFPQDVNVVVTNDQSKFTRDQLMNLENSIISGVILVVIVLLFFLGFRNSLFVGIAIPMSMLMGFLVLAIFGVTINMIVLFALILALGMLVDNGIVVVENIYRLMQEGYSPMRAAKEGAGEVAWPIIASTATTLAAFVPLAFWTGIMGEFMKYLPITLIIVLASSLFVALVINPVLTSKYMKVMELRTKIRYRRLAVFSVIAIVLIIIGHFAFQPIRNIALIVLILALLDAFLVRKAAFQFQKKFIPWLEEIYIKTLTFALSGYKPFLFLGGTMALLVFSIVLTVVRSPQVSLFPDNEPQFANMFIELPIGTDIEATNAFVEEMEARLFPLLEKYGEDVESVITQIGEGTGDQMSFGGGVTPHKARVTVSFVEFEYRKNSTAVIMEDIRSVFLNTPGALVTVEKNQMGPPVGPPVNIEIAGEDIERLLDIAENIKNTIDNSGIRGYEELKADVEVNKPELLVHIDREKAGMLGVSTYRVGSEIRTALFGKEVSNFKSGEDKYPIQLRLKDTYRYDVDNLLSQRITFRDQKGNMRQVPISSVASYQNSTTYNAVKRKDQDRVITLSSNVKEGYNANQIVRSIRELLSDYNLPEGYSIRYTGEQQEQEESGAFLMRAMIIAVFAIFLIIVTQFNSIGTPFIIMLSVLFSTIGVFLGLSIFNMDFIIIMTGIGIISLAGVVVNNAIVLIDFINLTRERRRKELQISKEMRLPFEEVKNCIVQGGKIRLRPVLLTAITTVLGLIPLAIGLNINFEALIMELNPHIYIGGDNVAFWGPMAWTVIFGLIFATFLTLVIVPVMYLILEKIAWAVTETRKEAEVKSSSR